MISTYFPHLFMATSSSFGIFRLFIHSSQFYSVVSPISFFHRIGVFLFTRNFTEKFEFLSCFKYHFDSLESNSGDFLAFLYLN